MDIVVWLRSLGLGKYEAVFRENEIDETVLPNLTAEDLKELGVTALGHRRKLLDAVAALRTDASIKASLVATEPARPAAETPTGPPIAEAVGECRHITVMFCDLVGSTSISAGLDAEDWRDLVGAYLDAIMSPPPPPYAPCTRDEVATAMDAGPGTSLDANGWDPRKSSAAARCLGSWRSTGRFRPRRVMGPRTSNQGRCSD